jgi:hypothetical protein
MVKSLFMTRKGKLQIDKQVQFNCIFLASTYNVRRRVFWAIKNPKPMTYVAKKVSIREPFRILPTCIAHVPGWGYESKHLVRARCDQ